MKVEKVSDNNLKILISEEELMENYDLMIEDLLDESKKADVSQAIVSLVKDASKAIGVEMKSGLSLKLCILNDDEVLVDASFLSEFSRDNLEGMANFLRDTQADFEDFARKMGLNKPNRETLEKLVDEKFHFHNEDSKTKYTLEFNSIDSAIDFSHMIKDSKKSSLLSLNKKYYIDVLFDEEKDLSYILDEFMIVNMPENFGSFLFEHGDVIIKDNAIKTLCKI